MSLVLILTSNDHIVSHGVTRLLRKCSSVELVQRSVNNAMLLSKLINELIPDTIIAEWELFFEHAPYFFEVMRAHPGLKVMVLSNRENVIHVYSQTSLPFHTGEELIKEVTAEVLQDPERIKA